MGDTDDKKVTNLTAARIARDQKAGAAAFRAGLCMRFVPYVFSDEGVGFIEGDFPLVVRNQHSNEGFCMTRESAAQLAEALTEALASPHAPWNKR